MASQPRQYETGYQALGSFYDDENEDTPPADNIIHVVPDRNKSRWNHIENLDEFFNRVYQYHQRNGFVCMVFQDVMQLIQFAFVVLFSTFLLKCVDYNTLFYETQYNGTHKVSIGEAVYPLNQCVARFDWVIVVCLLLAALFFMLRTIKMIYNICQYMEIREFYLHALKIPAEEMCNLTWHEVQRCLLEVQQEEQMCIHKQDLTELDIYHRILRFKNYMIAMVNKSLLPLTYRVPFVGEYSIMTTGLKYNLEWILFWGPWAPFENNWHLKSDYKNYQRRKELADQLSQKILWVGIANFVLCPLVFLWQILYSFFRYAESVKRSPGTLGARRWSLYGRQYLRHFNELDHEFDARLNRGYRPAERYMSSFTTPFLTILAKFVAFFAGSVLSVLVILTLVDEDFLHVSHVLSIIACLGAIVAICHALIPDEHMVWCPELLMRAVLSQIHYMPDHWKGNAHTFTIRDQFATLFQYKAVYLLEELVSPLVTPLVLCCSLRHKALDVVDFYRNFTVEVTGVGDVCSFAQMDIRKHGNPQWMSDSQSEANQHQQTADGKTELSLMHFTYTNPEWKPPQPSTAFLSTLRERVQQDATSMCGANPYDNPLATSLHSLTSVGYGQYNSMISSSMVQASAQPTPSSIGPSSFPGGPVSSSAGQSSFGPASFANPIYSSTVPTPPAAHASASSSSAGSSSYHPARPLYATVRGAGVRNSEGPLGGSTNGILSSVTHPQGAAGGMMGVSQRVTFAPSAANADVTLAPRVDEQTLELLSNEMSISALYMHELHRQRVGVVPVLPARGLYHDIPSSTAAPPPLQQRSRPGMFSGFSHEPMFFQRGGVEMRSPPRMQPLAPRSDEEVDKKGDDDDSPPPHQFNFDGGVGGMGATAGGMLMDLPAHSHRATAAGGGGASSLPPPPRQQQITGGLSQHRIPELIEEEGGLGEQQSGGNSDGKADTEKLLKPFS